MPWILAKEDADEEELRRVVLADADTADERRKRLRTELIRWHPDKFSARFDALLAPADRERISSRVLALSQALTALHAVLAAQQQQQ